MQEMTCAFLFLLCSGGIALAELPPETPWNTPHAAHDNYLSLSNPGYLETVTDAQYQVDITRVSDEGVFGQGGSGAAIHHQYSEVQAWNADSSKYWIGFNHILNDDDDTVYKTLNVPMHDGRWSELNPNIRYFCDGNQFKEIDITTEIVTTLHTFVGYGDLNVGDYQGQISLDEKIVLTEEKHGAKAVLYDINNDLVLREFVIPGRDATMTRSGVYVQVHNLDGTASYYDWQNDPGMNNPISTFRVSHDNFAFDTNGDEVVVNLSPLKMYRISDGLETDLLPSTEATEGTCGVSTSNPYVGGHVSSPNDLPGWAFVSAGIDDCNNSFNGFYHRTEQFLVKLDGSGTIRHFGFSRSSYGEVPEYNDNEIYFSEAKSAVRQDGAKATFTSDWNSADGIAGDLVQYVVEVVPVPEPSFEALAPVLLLALTFLKRKRYGCESAR